MSNIDSLRCPINNNLIPIDIYPSECKPIMLYKNNVSTD